jgi:hypothetical protein
VFNEHIEADGPTVFAHACKLGLEDRVEAEGLDLYYGSGGWPDWRKSKDPACVAVKRGEEGDWGR